MNIRRVTPAALAALLVLLLAACNVPTDPNLGQPGASGADDLAGQEAVGPAAILDVSTSQQQLSSCEGELFGFNVVLSPADPAPAAVVLNYRVASDEPGADGWQQLDLLSAANSEAVLWTLETDAIGADARAAAASSVEYWIAVTDTDGGETSWPGGANEHASLPVAACGEQADAADDAAANEYVVHEYGASPQFVQYGTCGSAAVTFDIVIEGLEQVEGVLVKTSWNAQGTPSEHALSDEGPAQGYPSARRYATTLDLAAGAQQSLGDQGGVLAWNIYVTRSDQTVLEYPLGGPPVIQVDPCPGPDLAPQPTATEPLVLIPLPTATPLVLINPGPLPYSSGQETMLEGHRFDLDEGDLITGGPCPGCDFRLGEGDDPYLDDIEPYDGVYFGWFGASQPSKQDCQNTLKANAPMTIQWPDHEDTYYCYETNAGRAGWMRVDLWVSLPINERRFEFSWRTFQ